MIPRVKVITQPTIEPVTRAEVKSWIRVASATTTFDGTIDFLIQAARETCELARGEAFLEQTLEAYFDCWPGWNQPTGTAGYNLPGYGQARGSGRLELPRATPLQSITYLKYTDSSGIQTTMSASDYVADVNALVGALVLKPEISWPSTDLYSVDPIVVRYVAGVPNTSPAQPLPNYIRLAMRHLITHWFEHPSAIIIGDNSAMALAAADLLRLGRRVHRF